MTDQIRLFPEPPAAVTLHYWRYGARDTQEYGSVEDAIRSAAWQVEDGQIVCSHLELADGRRIEGAELDQLLDSARDRMMC